jgi:hypothetical protein
MGANLQGQLHFPRFGGDFLRFGHGAVTFASHFVNSDLQTISPLVGACLSTTRLEYSRKHIE